MTTDPSAPAGFVPRSFLQPPPEARADGGDVDQDGAPWPVLVVLTNQGVTDAATPGSRVAEAALQKETAFLQAKKRQLDLSPRLSTDVPEGRIAGIASWSDLTDDVLLTILANTGLLKGLRLDPERLVLEPAERTALTVDVGALRGAVNLCREDFYTHRACEDEVETVLAKSSVVKGSASVSYAFVSAKVEASQRERSTTQAGRRSVTAVGRQLSRRAVVFLSPDLVGPTRELLEEVHAALARPDLVAQAQALSEVFEAFGLIWAQEVGLGSARTVATEVEVSEAASSGEVERHISAAMNVKYGGASGGATAEAGQDTSSDAHVRNEVAQASSTTMGDVESPLHWAVIARARLAPVYEVLPRELRDRVLDVLFRARPELVERVFSDPQMVPRTTQQPPPAPGAPPPKAGTGAAAGTPREAPAAGPEPQPFTPVKLRSHTATTGDALLLVSCEGAGTEAGWCQIDVEATDSPTGPCAGTRLATAEAPVDAGDQDDGRTRMAAEALIPHTDVGVKAAAKAAPGEDQVVASHSVLIPVRWPDAYTLRQRRGVRRTGPWITTVPIEIIAFRGENRSYFDAWTEWLPWDPRSTLSATCPDGATLTEDLSEGPRVASVSVSWTPQRSGLLVVTAVDQGLDGTSPGDRASVDARISQGRLRASLIADPRRPTPLSVCVPVVMDDPLALTLTATHYRWAVAARVSPMGPEDREADGATEVPRAWIPLRLWFLPIRDAMAHMGSPEPIVVNDVYEAHADGFVTVHDPAGTAGTVSVMVPGARLQTAVGGDPGSDARMERPRAMSTRLPGATVTAPVRQGETFRAVVSDEAKRRVEDPNQLPDRRDAFPGDDPDQPRAVFVPLRLVIPS